MDLSPSKDSTILVQQPPVDSHHRFLDGVHSIPEEILLEIFKAGLQIPEKQSEFWPGTTTDSDFSMLVSAVCHSWRHIATNSPTLWTNIWIPSSFKYDATIFFERSNPALINVTFDTLRVVNQVFRRESYNRISQLIEAHIGRLRQLKICVGSIEDARTLTESFHELPAQNLQNLEVLLLSDESMDFVPHSRLMINTPLLRNLKVRSICLHCCPPLFTLTHLDISKYCPTVTEFRELFCDCPSMETLILRQFGAPGWVENVDTPSSIMAPSLLSLAVSFDRFHDSHGSHACACALSALSAENLEYFEVALHSSFDLSAHLSATMRAWQKSPRLRVRFEKLQLRMEDRIFINSLPKTADLELINIDDIDIIPILLLQPSFRSIALDITCSTLPGLQDNIISYAETGSAVILLTPTESYPIPPEWQPTIDALKNRAAFHSTSFQTGLIVADNEIYDYIDIEEELSDSDPDYDLEYDFDGDGSFLSPYESDEYDYDEYDDYDDDEGLEGVAFYGGPL